MRQLGQRFLRQVYKGMLESPSFIGFVYEEEGMVEGFVAGSQDTSTMMKQVFRDKAHRLGTTGIMVCEIHTSSNTFGNAPALSPKQQSTK